MPDREEEACGSAADELSCIDCALTNGQDDGSIKSLHSTNDALGT